MADGLRVRIFGQATRSTLWLAAAIALGLTPAAPPISAQVQTCVAPPQDLMSWWPADRSADDLVGVSHGTLGRDAAFATGRVEAAFQFTGGVQSVVTVPHDESLNIGGAFTVEAWIYPTGLPNEYPMIVHKGTGGNRWVLSLTNDTAGGTVRALSLNINDDGTNSLTSASNVITLNAWNHIAATVDERAQWAFLYVDGAQVAFRSTASTVRTTSAAALLIGGGGPTGAPEASRMYAGLVDELTIYRRALAEAEIRAIAAAGSAGKCKVQDLVLRQVQVTPSFRSGRAVLPLLVRAVVHSRGPVRRPVDIVFFDGDFREGEARPTPIGSVQLPGLAAGEDRTSEAVTWEQADYPLQGRRGVTAIVDPDDVLAEADEANNRRTEPVLDLAPAGLIPIQVVQGSRIPTVPLVKDKATMVRVGMHLGGQDSVGVEGMALRNVTLHLTCGTGIERCEDQKMTIHLVDTRRLHEGQITAPLETLVAADDSMLEALQLYHAESSVTYLDASIFSSGVDKVNFPGPFYPREVGDLLPDPFEVQIDPRDEILETNENNNSSFMPVPVKAVQPFLGRFGYFVMFLDHRRPEDRGRKVADFAAEQCRSILALFPLPSRWQDSANGLWCFADTLPRDHVTRGREVAVEDYLRKLAVTAKRLKHFRFVGVLPAGALGKGNIGKSYEEDGFRAVLVDQPASHPFTTAHEIGHTFRFCDEYHNHGFFLNPHPDECPNMGNLHDQGIVALTAGVQQDGWDVEGRRPRVSGHAGDLRNNFNHESFMGTTLRPWIRAGDWDLRLANNHYMILLDKLVTGGRDPQVLFVSGEIVRDGGFFLAPFWEGEAELSESAPGDYAFETLNGSGSVLSTLTFAPVFRQADERRERDVTSFSLNLPFSDEVRTIRFSRRGQVLQDIVVSAHAPQITISAVRSLPDGQQIEVDWVATDADGDPMEFAVDYTPDGVRFLPVLLSLDRVESPLIIRTGELPGGQLARIRITATDGVNTTVAPSNPFAVPTKAPTAGILEPAGSHGLSGAEPIRFSGFGYDLEEGFLAETSLEWADSVDGLLGTGELVERVLSPGSHLVTLIARDREGNASSAQITIDVLPDGDLDGMPDAYEQAHPCLDVAARDAFEDPDEDQVINREEARLGTDACQRDTDQDGLLDRDELLGRTDPTDADTDHDGMSDGDESPRPCLNPLVPEDAQDDADGDGLSNVAEVEMGSDPCPRTQAAFTRGDANGDGTVDISDAIRTLGVLFLGQGTLSCQDAADANDDGTVDISDPVATLGALFIGGPPIRPPFPGCGLDPTDDLLACEEATACP